MHLTARCKCQQLRGVQIAQVRERYGICYKVAYIWVLNGMYEEVKEFVVCNINPLPLVLLIMIYPYSS